VRRKKTLPVLHAFQHASPQDQAALRSFYQLREPPTQAQVKRVLDILDSAQSRAYCQHALREHCQQARAALAQVGTGAHALEQRALSDLAVLIEYVAEDLWPA
jgi:geranylgeranyl diphosphate synthase type I